jgi:hypothetical protein
MLPRRARSLIVERDIEHREELMDDWNLLPSQAETWSVPEVSPQIRPPESLSEQGGMISRNPVV